MFRIVCYHLAKMDTYIRKDERNLPKFGAVDPRFSFKIAVMLAGKT